MALGIRGMGAAKWGEPNAMSIVVKRGGTVTWRGDTIGTMKTFRTGIRRYYRFQFSSDCECGGLVRSLRAPLRSLIINELVKIMIAYERTEGGK